MFSFEGNYKAPRKINYNNEKELGKIDIIQKAKSEREKRALVTRQIAAATLIQNSYRQYIKRKIKRQHSLIDFQSLIGDLSSKTDYSTNVTFLEAVIIIINKLLMFYDHSYINDQPLKLLIEVITRRNITKVIFNNQSPDPYYNSVSLALLLRVTARHMSIMPDNSPSTQYNIYLRFFEIYLTSFVKSNYEDIQSNSFQKTLYLFLIKSNYFHYITVFISRQMIKNEPAESCYKQTKVNYVLKVMLAPVQQLLKSDMLNDVVLHYINGVYSKTEKYRQDNVINTLKLMSLALSDLITWDVIVDIIYNHCDKTYITYSIGIIYFLLGLQPPGDDTHFVHSAKASAQIVILFFRLSSTLFSKNEMFLSNNILQITDSNVWIAPRDNFDFDMKESVSNYDSAEEISDDDSDDNHMTQTELTDIDEKVMSSLENEIAYSLKYRFSHIVLPLAILDESESIDKNELINAIGFIYYLLILKTKIIGGLESKIFILNLIPTSKTISRRLWNGAIFQVTNDTDKSVMDLLIKGELNMSVSEMDLFFGKLLCFANCLHWKLLSVQDLDLISLTSDRSFEVLEFTSDELCAIVLKLRDLMCGLILLLYPSSSIFKKNQSSPLFMEKLTKTFIELQRVVIRLYNRDVRKGLKMSGKRLEWVKSDVSRININNLKNFRNLLLEDYKFGKMFSQLTFTDMRQFVILKEMPFIVPIGTRMKILKQIITSIEPFVAYAEDRISVRVRRDHIYDDAFNQITKKTLPNLRSHLRIEFIDHFGFDEAGIDGGGLLREFLNSIILEACDPKRGLFVSTTNNLLYPNPEIETLYPENWKSHFYFIGRMLGLILFKGLLVQVPLAPFFIQKLFSNKSSREEIDIDNLQYLDDDLYRNLLSLKSMATVEDISLDFTMSRHCCGVTTTVELKPNGSNILVTNDNKIEYIYLVADYKLNQQIASQTAVIISGVNDILPIDCFRLFDLDELSFIVTGGGAVIDLEDLRRNTVYHGLDGVETSETIQYFWEVVFTMTEEEKRSFIQFVTSLSRAPMLGFRELTPKFAIAIVPDTDRLPTASTCLNLLKLPAYKNLQEMRKRLLYAIGSDTGFHLS